MSWATGGGPTPGWSNDPTTGTNPLADLVERDGFRPRWLSPQALTTLADPEGTVWRLSVHGAFRGDALADLAWLESEHGYRVILRPRLRARDSAPFIAVTIRSGVSE